MVCENRCHLSSTDRAVISCDGVRPEEHVQHLVKGAFIADDAEPPDVAVELVLRVATSSVLCGREGPFAFVERVSFVDPVRFFLCARWRGGEESPLGVSLVSEGKATFTCWAKEHLWPSAAQSERLQI